MKKRAEEKPISTHDLTRRSTRGPHLQANRCFKFQLTTSRGGRLDPGTCYPACGIFQLTTSRGGRRLSCDTWPRGSCISTHDLTRRSTWLYNICYSVNGYFNSRPHEEVDKTRLRATTWENISTHDLTRRSTRPPHGMYGTKMPFQLTTSRGGRRMLRSGGH